MTKLKKVGRPSTFTEAKGDALIEAAKTNPSKVDQAALVGVPLRTFQSWLKKGEEGHPEFIVWYVKYQKAMGQFKNELISNMRAAGAMVEKPHSQRANEYLLEKFFPKEFGALAKSTVNIQQNIGQQINLKELPTEKLDALLGEIDALEADIIDVDENGE